MKTLKYFVLVPFATISQYSSLFIVCFLFTAICCTRFDVLGPYYVLLCPSCFFFPILLLFIKKNLRVPFNFLSHRKMRRILIFPELKIPLTIYSLLLSTSKTSTDSFSCAYVFLLFSTLYLIKFFCSSIAQFLKFMFYLYYV